MSTVDGEGPAAAAAALEPSTAAAQGPRLFARFGLAIAHPRWALAVAADRRHAGRSGSDLIVGFLLLLLATQLRGVISAIWLGSAVATGFGLSAALRMLTGALTVDLGLLVVGSLVLFALAGPRRNLGRAFDLVCVAALPLVFVELIATVAVRSAGIDVVPVAASWLLSGLSFGWMGALVALATRPARIAPRRVSPPPAVAVRQARWFGAGAAALVVLGVVVQLLWIAGHLELVKPMTDGDPAPMFALPQIGPTGQLGERVSLETTRGKVTVLDFWATWCGPCLASMPRLEQLARSHPDVAVLAINTDDPARARAVFNEHGYTMKLLSDDSGLADRYGVTALPYTVILDREGRVREVVRGTGHDLAALVDAAGASTPSGGSPVTPSGGSPATRSAGPPATPSAGKPAGASE
jgi:thiol-disulfide isomerase/thioredoxin